MASVNSVLRLRSQLPTPRFAEVHFVVLSAAATNTLDVVLSGALNTDVLRVDGAKVTMMANINADRVVFTSTASLEGFGVVRSRSIVLDGLVIAGMYQGLTLGPDGTTVTQRYGACQGQPCFCLLRTFLTLRGPADLVFNPSYRELRFVNTEPALVSQLWARYGFIGEVAKIIFTGPLVLRSAVLGAEVHRFSVPYAQPFQFGSLTVEGNAPRVVVQSNPPQRLACYPLATLPPAQGSLVTSGNLPCLEAQQGGFGMLLLPCPATTESSASQPINCQNGGSVVSGAVSNFCQCPFVNGFGYEGSECEEYVCANDCNGIHGKCVAPSQAGALPVCQCEPGFAGASCLEVLCAPFCANGECHARSGAPVCECFAGFDGPGCSDLVAAGACPDACSGHGACNATTGVCSCAPGWTGLSCNMLLCLPNEAPTLAQPNCQSKCPLVLPRMCTHTNAAHGACTLSSTGPKATMCTCAAGFSGPECAQRTCMPDSCANGAECVQQADGQKPTCICGSGYAGLRCSLRVASAPLSMSSIIVISVVCGVAAVAAVVAVVGLRTRAVQRQRERQRITDLLTHDNDTPYRAMN